MAKEKYIGKDGMGRRLYAGIDMATKKDQADPDYQIVSEGIRYVPYEYVSVYRGKGDDNDICYDSSRKLTEQEIVRIEKELNVKTKMEFLSGVGCIYVPA